MGTGKGKGKVSGSRSTNQPLSITPTEGPRMRIFLACPYPCPPRPDGHSPLARYSPSFYFSSSSFFTSSSSSPPLCPCPALVLP
eukprot:1448047-Pyramimonas_sp.AAC.1